MADRLTFAHGTSAEWALSTTPLAVAQPGLDTDTGDVRLGNGNDLWLDLPIAFNMYGTNSNAPSVIDDSQTSATTTWSSQQTQSQIDAGVVRANRYADQVANGGPRVVPCIQNSDGTWPATVAGTMDITLYLGTVGLGSAPPAGPNDRVNLKDPS